MMSSSSTRIDMPTALPATTSKRAAPMGALYRASTSFVRRCSRHCARPAALIRWHDMGRLRLTNGPLAGRTLTVGSEVVIGRDGTDLAIDDDEVSTRHAVVRRAGRALEVEDLG